MAEWGKEVQRTSEQAVLVNKMSQGAEVAAFFHSKVLHQPSPNCCWFPGCLQSPADRFSPKRLQSWLPEWKDAWWLHRLDVKLGKGANLKVAAKKRLSTVWYTGFPAIQELMLLVFGVETQQIHRFFYMYCCLISVYEKVESKRAFT